MSAPAVQSACAYCGKEHAHDLICGEMFVTHAQVLSRKDGEMSTTPKWDNPRLEELRIQSQDKSLSSKQAYINGLEFEFAALQAQLDAEREAHKRTSRQANEAIETANASCAVERKAREFAEKCLFDNGRELEQRAEAAEAELTRINPLYTAACIRARDAEHAGGNAVAAPIDALAPKDK